MLVKSCILTGLLLLAGVMTAPGASIVVAAANTPAKAKARADLVCDGTHDEVELLAALTRAPKVHLTLLRADTGATQTLECLGKHSVEWLPGDYTLEATLAIPDATELAINAEGACLHYQPARGDAVTIAGISRCLYRLGRIETASDGAALRLRPAASMPALTSRVSFTGLAGQSQRGTGLHVDPSRESICHNEFNGTDIAGFAVGVRVDEALSFCRANWFYLNDIRRCSAGVEERGQGVESNDYWVQVETAPSSTVPLQSAGAFGKWQIMLGIAGGALPDKPNPKLPSLTLNPGARGNTYEFYPPLGLFAPVSNESGNKTNVILSADRPPLGEARANSRHWCKYSP